MQFTLRIIFYEETNADSPIREKKYPRFMNKICSAYRRIVDQCYDMVCYFLPTILSDHIYFSFIVPDLH